MKIAQNFIPRILLAAIFCATISSFNQIQATLNLDQECAKERIEAIFKEASRNQSHEHEIIAAFSHIYFPKIAHLFNDELKSALEKTYLDYKEGLHQSSRTRIEQLLFNRF